MLNTIAITTSNRFLQRYPRLLLHRIKNQHNVYMASNAASNDDNENCDNPQNLPRMPVPCLEETFEKYLRSLKPLLNEQEYNCSKEAVRDFAGPCGSAKKLQEYLLKRAETHTNWLEEWWLNVAYLGYRDPVVIFSSPGQTFPFVRFDCEDDRVNHAAKLIMAAISYKILIDKKKIPVDKMGKFELDMKQYEKILGTCRIPAAPKDNIEYHSKSKHIIVAHNNHFFKVNAMSDRNEPMSKNQLVNQLKCVLAQSPNAAAPVGVLTTENRDTWAKVYKQLIKNECNRQSAKEIQTSLFLVCLDKPTSTSIIDNRLTAAMKQFIHGGSSKCNSGNRWFDKTVQFILSPTGEVGLTYEHSPSEGQPVAVMVDFLYNYIKKDLGDEIEEARSCQDPIRLEFELDDEITNAIENAEKNINKLTCNLELNCFKFDKYGKEFVKAQKMSPDSFIQMALQAAFYKIHKKPAAHYESAATRLFIGGRTETIRSCSVESVAFAKKLLDCSASDDDKVTALREAVNSHKKYTIAAVQGKGVDRHLLGLKLAAGKLKIDVPPFYEDVGWKRSTYMRISSSQVATKCDGLMGYAPLVKEGYGCCYNPRADEINFSVSSFEDYPNTSAIKFKASLEWCLTEMQTILLKTKKSKI